MWKTVCQSTHREKGKLNRLISIKEVESILNNLPKQKAQGPDEITDEFIEFIKGRFYMNYLKSLSEYRCWENTF